MSKTTRNLKLGRPPNGECSGFRSRVRDFGSKLTTPLGTSCLAAFSLVVGLQVGGSVELPTTALQESNEEMERTSAELRQLRGKLALREIQAQRLRDIQGYSARYGVPADLAASIYDVALAERLEPGLAFKLVHTESSFRRRAVSEAGAVGYTQIKPSTARLLDPTVSRKELFETETNLRLGFRYLRFLLEQYDDDLRLALLAYNRGPTRVGALLALGQDPANGYASRVLRGLE